MDLITDYAVLSSILSKWKKERGRNFYTNFFVFGENLRHIIEQENLYYEVSDDCVLIFLDEGNYFQFYYYLAKDADLPHIPVHKTVSAWLVRNEGIIEDVKKQKEKLEAAGFLWKETSAQYSMSLEEEKDAIQKQYEIFGGRIAQEGLQIGYLSMEDDSTEIQRLWEASFEVYRRPDLSERLEEIIQNKNVMIVRDVMTRNRKIVATQMMEIQNKTIHTSKTCVHEAYRGKGIGKMLLISSLMDAMQRGCRRWIVEIDENNISSIRMHSIVPMVRTGILSEQFVYRCTS